MENETITGIKNEAVTKTVESKNPKELEKILHSHFTELSEKTATRLIEVLSYQFDENDENVQERLYYRLDKMIDGIAKKNFIKAKRIFRFKSVNQINDYILKEFSRIDKYNQEFLLKKITNVISQKIEDKDYPNMIFEQIKAFYQYYCQYRILPRELTTGFYNQVLNKQEETYLIKTKKELQKGLTKTLPYTAKKEKSRIVSGKLKKINSLLANRNYLELGITEAALKELISNYDIEINKVKKLQKQGFHLTKEQLAQINTQFIIGQLNKNSLDKILPNANTEAKEVILNKYNLIKAKFLDNISITSQELPTLELEYHYLNFKIGTMKDTYKTIANIISTISEEEAQDILFNSPLPQEILELMPLVGHIDGFNIDEMLLILRSYPLVQNHMQKEGMLKENTIDCALSHFFSFLTITEAYTSADDITMSILGNDTIEEIRFSDKLTSKNPIDYLNVYTSMLAREYTYIPRVEGEFEDYDYVSALDADTDRLLIGKKCNFSCIGPKGAGEEAYFQALTGHKADVIMIKDKKTQEFFARILCFRQGNYVVLAPIQGKSGIEKSLYKKEFLSAIGKQMLETSIKEKDTLEYVFLSPDGRFLDDIFPIVEDDNLIDPFPHADLDAISYVIASTKPKEQININPMTPMPQIYKTKRENIQGTDEISNHELTKIKALDILLTEDKEAREEKERNFEPVNKNNYDDVYKGQDWYIALKDGKIEEEVILPTELETQQEELRLLKEKLLILNIIDQKPNDNLEVNNKGGKK